MSTVKDQALAADLIPDHQRPDSGEVVTEAATPRQRWWHNRPVIADLASISIFILMALYVTERMWRHLDNYYLTANHTDQIQFEYFLEHAARIVTHGQYPFFTPQLNAPDGVNLMANTATLGLHLPLVPVTLLFGPQVSFAVMVTLGMATTAAAWYWLFSRHVVSSRFAAFVAGGFCGFAPGMISQANGHPNIAMQLLVPIILWWGMRLRQPHRMLRNGVVLGLLITYQSFINEEVLFITAMASATFIAVWAFYHRPEAREALPSFWRGLAVAAVTSLALLAYPLYVQFFGPQNYHGLWVGANRYGTDVMAFSGFSRQSVAGYPAAAKAVSQNPSEENAFLGWPLLVLFAMLAVLFWRNLVARIAVITGVLLALLSLGPWLQFKQQNTSIPGPYLPFAHVPLFDSVISTRLVLVLIPVIALLMALWVQQAMTALRGSREEVFRGRLVAIGLVVAALLPIAPTPLRIAFRAPTPAFFASGEWRRYVPAGRTVVTVPVTSLANAMEGMQWAADAHLDFPVAGGYFLGPDPTTVDRQGRFGPPPRPTSELLSKIAIKGTVPVVNAHNRAQARADLQFWKASILVMAPRKYGEKLIRTTTDLVGVAPHWINGVWVWDVRSIVS
jgi:hypothetical protein